MLVYYTRSFWSLPSFKAKQLAVLSTDNEFTPIFNMGKSLFLTCDVIMESTSILSKCDFTQFFEKIKLQITEDLDVIEKNSFQI